MDQSHVYTLSSARLLPSTLVRGTEWGIYMYLSLYIYKYVRTYVCIYRNMSCSGMLLGMLRVCCATISSPLEQLNGVLVRILLHDWEVSTGEYLAQGWQYLVRPQRGPIQKPRTEYSAVLPDVRSRLLYDSLVVQLYLLRVTHMVVFCGIEMVVSTNICQTF